MPLVYAVNKTFPSSTLFAKIDTQSIFDKFEQMPQQTVSAAFCFSPFLRKTKSLET